RPSPEIVIFGRPTHAPRPRRPGPFGCSGLAFVYYLHVEDPGCALSTKPAAARNRGGGPRSDAGSWNMSDVSQRTFRAVALQRAASPEQLDHLVRITRP